MQRPRGRKEIAFDFKEQKGDRGAVLSEWGRQGRGVGGGR